MKLYMKQKVFSWVDRFTIRDADENDRYFVEGEFFTWGKKLHLYDAGGSEVAFIRQKLWSFLPRFFVYVDGEQAAEIVKEFTFLKPRYRIEGPGWEVLGDLWGHNYEISERGESIVCVHKAWFTWGDSYELDIRREGDEVKALAVVLAIDCVMDQAAATASS